MKPSPEKLEKMMREKQFDLIFEGTGTSSGKMRNDVVVEWPAIGERFELATDEGAFHGGDGTAPPPLALFTAALTGCLMTQIRAFSKRLDLEVTDVRVKTSLHWTGTQTADEPYVSHPKSFKMDVEINGPASADDLTRLLQAAKKGCFIEQTLSEGIEVAHRILIDGRWQDC